MKTRTKLVILEATLGILGAGLAWYWYGWRLVIVLFLVSWSLNIHSRLEDMKTFNKVLIVANKLFGEGS